MGMGRLGDALVDSIAASIQQMEGYIPPNAQYPQGSLAYQNNNPGNLRLAGQAGATQGAGGFAKFPSYAAGYAALQNQIQYQINAGQNLTQFFNQYAPSIENNTPGYIAFVAQQTGIDPTVPLVNYQNGTATIGVSAGGAVSPPVDSLGTANDTGIFPDTSTSTSLIDTITSDPVLLGGTAIIGLGLLYALFG